MVETLSETERFPLLTEEGRRLLRRLHENEFAPRYNHHCGDRLTIEGLRRVRDFEIELKSSAQDRHPGDIPSWLLDFTKTCCRDVPHYRGYKANPADFFSIPTCDRSDLSREPWSFVPDTQDLDDLIVYCTSGTTGHPLDVLSHPVVSSMYLPLLRTAAATYGVALEGRQGHVAIVLICFQKSTLTYAAISAYLDQAGLVKINLNPADWRHPADRARFLDACRPEIYTGDPISFMELASLAMQSRPKALLSTAMTLPPRLQKFLEHHFQCPVIDIYSMNEAGPVAVRDGTGHVPLQRRLYIEILDKDGLSCPPGERGEITLSGGFNPYLPLLRYRTGDWARLEYRGTLPVLKDLEGRAPVLFRDARGNVVNSIDISSALKPLALVRFHVYI